MGLFSICGQVAANMGQIDCDVRRGNPTLIIAGSAIAAPSDYATLAAYKAWLIGKIKQSNTASDKMFVFPVIQGNSDQTEAAKYGTLGYGLKIKLLRSKQGYEFDVLCGSSLEKKLIKFDGKILPLKIFDDQDDVYGVTDTNSNFSGANYLIGVEPAGFGDAQNPKTTKITISIIDAKDFTENSRYISTDFSTNDLTTANLLDAYLYSTAANASNVYHIGAKIITDALNTFLNVHDKYATLLASAALWTAFTGTNFGTALTLTTVANDATNGGWTVTFDSTAYTALSSGAQIKLNFASVPVLDAAGVTGIEGNYMIITKP